MIFARERRNAVGGAICEAVRKAFAARSAIQRSEMVELFQNIFNLFLAP